MKIKLAITIFLVFLSATKFGAALKCNVGAPGDMNEEECSGSCTTLETTHSGVTTTTLECGKIKENNGCEEQDGDTLCFCNTDLCNTGTSKNGTSAMRANSFIVILMLFTFLGKRIFQL